MRQETEGETAEYCELNELWDAGWKVATFIHSLYHIHDKELCSLFPFFSATCCLSLMLSVFRPAICKICLTLTPKQGMPTFTMALHYESGLASAWFLHTLWWITSETRTHIAVRHICLCSCCGSTATVCGVVRSGEWQLCELCGMLPLGFYCTLTTENHTQLQSTTEKRSHQVTYWLPTQTAREIAFTQRPAQKLTLINFQS